jgi:purine nucleoside phosphorylase
MRCLCVSMVANPGAGLSDDAVTHEDVLAAGQAAAGNLRRLLGAVLAAPGLV